MAGSESKDEPIFPWANVETLQPLVAVLVAMGVFGFCWLHAIHSWAGSWV